MTSCADVRENISAYADNELDINERQSFEEHINKCPSCKEELEDMLRIIAICQNMPQQELPTGFKAELHEKLTAVSARRENIHVVRQKPKSVVFARTIATIAAGTLLIFLGGSIVRYGLFSEGFMSKTADSAEINAATQAPEAAPSEEGFAFSLSAMPDTSDIQSSEPPASAGAGEADMDYGKMESEKPLEAPAKNYAVDRSVAMEARDDGSYKGIDNDTAARKTSTVTITTKDIAAALGQVTVLASANNGMIPAGDAALNSPADSPDMAALSVTQDEAEAHKQLQYVFTEADYSAFTKALNDTFGAADVQTGAFVSEDMTDMMNILIDQSVLFDAEIQKLQMNNSSKNQEEINTLKNEKENIDGQIEKIRLDSDFVTVTVYVNIK